MSTSAARSTSAIAFVGLGQMGLPMAKCCLAAGFAVRGADTSAAARARFTEAGGTSFATGAEAAAGADFAITMLPDGKFVQAAVLGPAGLASVLAPGALVIDMSSSAPADTKHLGESLAKLKIGLIDAPVSGGVRRAVDGSLALMAGGDPADVDRARPLLAAMSKSIFATGPLGSGHAMKALNNYVSAAGLAAASEALLIGRTFGLAPEMIVDVLNASTGRNNSTEVKMKQFVIAETFASGFSLGLMAKDLRTAADLASQLGLEASFAETVARLWEDARSRLGAPADHTEIYRYLAGDEA